MVPGLGMSKFCFIIILFHEVLFFSSKTPDALMSSPNPPTLYVPEAFVGTPINMLTKRMSR